MNLPKSCPPCGRTFAASAEELKDGSKGQNKETDQLVPELPTHLLPKLKNDGLQRINGDLHVLQGARGSIGLEDDVKGGEHLQQDPDLVEGHTVDHALECSDGVPGCRLVQATRLEVT